MARLPGVRRLFRLPRAERDVGANVDDELAFHIEMLTEHLVSRGRSPAEARREALERFGDLAELRRNCYDISTTHQVAVRRSEMWSTIWQDVRYAARGLGRAPGFAVVVLLTLALGIGATTAMFSVVRGVLLRPLPFPQSERVVRLSPVNPAANAGPGYISAIELDDWQRDLTSFSQLGGFRLTGGGKVFGDGIEPLYAPTTYVSKGFFSALGTKPALGRTLIDGEHVVGANHAVVVSHNFWTTHLGGNSGILGQAIRLDGEPFIVVGVMPTDFAYPAPEVAFWVPNSLLGEDDICCGRDARWLEVVARLKPGVTPEQGRAEVQTLLTRLAGTFPETNGGWISASVENVRDAIVGPVRRGLLVLLGAVGLVLLVVCVNVANLLLVRGTARERELALRGAIGAGRGRIVRLLLTESMLLATCGGLLGVLAAWWGVRALVALSGHFLPRAADIRLDGSVLAFSIIVSLLTGALFGLWPALRASRGSGAASTLREDSRGSVGSRGANRARSALVAMEVALAVVLVVGAGLMLRSFERLTGADPGFRPENVLLLRFSLPEPPEGQRSPDRAGERRRVVDRVRLVPGAIEVGATKNAPLTPNQGEPRPFTVPGRPVPPKGEEPRVLFQPASPGYLKAMGIPLLAGEDINATSGGDSTAPVPAVISKRMADRIWPGQSAIGETFLAADSRIQVIGVAGDVRNARLDSVAGFTAYLPDRAMPRSGVSLVVRTTGDPMKIAGPVQAAIREVYPGMAFLEVTPFVNKMSQAASTPRFFTVLVAIFGSLALILAAIGLYGVVSYTVRQREREMAVRLALGAAPSRVTTLMLRQGMMPVIVGLAIGLASAFAATRVMQSLLFEVSATDPLTYVAVAVLLAAVALIASYLPSRRAARVHPAMTLRAE